MNLILLDSAALHGPVVIDGRVAKHVRTVLQKKEGDDLKVGIWSHGLGRARIASMASSGRIVLELSTWEPRPQPRVELIVALPRPKGLSRLLQTIAAFGVRRIDLIDGYRVDKSYFQSTRLHPSRVHQDLALGCEQGTQCWLPECRVYRGFGSYVRETLPERVGDGAATQLLLHPDSVAFPTLRHVATAGAVRLAFGPEGGWTNGELACFERAGFERIRLGSAILRTEIAIAAALGQLALLEAQLQT